MKINQPSEIKRMQFVGSPFQRKQNSLTLHPKEIQELREKRLENYDKN